MDNQKIYMELCEKYQIGDTVVLTKKKANGHPRNRNIGEQLIIVERNLNPKCPRIGFKGNKHPRDVWWVSINYVTKLEEYLADNREESIDDLLNEGVVFLSDNKRHLICYPYSIDNLHKMAEDLNIKKCWFHKDHYDIPKKRIDEITEKTRNLSSKNIVNIIKGKKLEQL